MSSQGVMSSEQTNNSPGLCPIEGQQYGLKNNFHRCPYS